ncbi:ABC transporter substrate-binding protein [Roseomonas sp. BN140053]|uniref:ABC transporter substrate-binding protein n=1 Tax=Roseomonas sp. BN140053 TaxID=3391898 RepID=UPI0039EC3650
MPGEGGSAGVAVLRRRVALGLLAAPALLASRGARAQAGEKLTLITPFGFIVDFLEMMNAVAGEHLKRQGFDPVLLGGSGSAQAIQQVVTGQARMLRISGIDMMKAVSQANLPLISVATIYQAGGFYLISHKDKPLPDIAAVNGKRIGVVSVGGSTENFLDLMLRKGGFDPTATRREVVGNNPAALGLVQAGRIDGFIASTNVVEALTEQKAAFEAWPTDRYAPMPGQCYVVRRDTAEREGPLLVRTLKAMRGSAEELLAPDVSPMIRRASREFEIPGIRNLPATVRTFEASRRAWLTEGRENLLRNVPALFANGAAELTDAGIARLPDPTILYTNRFVDEALA